MQKQARDWCRSHSEKEKPEIKNKRNEYKNMPEEYQQKVKSMGKAIKKQEKRHYKEFIFVFIV